MTAATASSRLDGPLDPGRASSLDRSLGWIVAAASAGLALWRAAGSPQWRADLGAVRDHGLTSVGLGGSLSTALSQLTGLFPLGSLAFRASAGSALALGVAALLLAKLTRSLLRGWVRSGDAVAPSLVSVVTAIAVAAVTLSPSWQQEGTVGGSATVGALAALATLALVVDQAGPKAAWLTPDGVRAWILAAGCAAAAFAESLPAGLAAMLAVGACLLVARRLPPARLRGLGLGVLLLAALLLVAPAILRAVSPRSWHDVARVLSVANLSPLRSSDSRILALLAWTGELGFVSLGLSALGLAAGLWRRASRPITVALGLLVVLDVLYPASATDGLSAQPLLVLRLLATGALGVMSALGVVALLQFLLGLDIPMAKPAAVLTVAFHATVVAVTCEEAHFATDRSGHLAVERWTDDALGQLPPRAALLVRSPALAWRLWSARMIRGERPDVLVVPEPLLAQLPAVTSMLAAEPDVEPLLRDLAVGGEASEYALSLLADARPLYVELDARWDKRLVSHLRVDGLWLRYAAETLGETDRRPSGIDVVAVDSPLAKAVVAGTVRDDATGQVVARALKEQAATLSLLGQCADARAVVERIALYRADDPFITGARLRLAAGEPRRTRTVELRDLLRF